MTGSHGYSQFVKQHADIVGMNIPNQKRYDCAFVFRSSENPHAVNFHQLSGSIAGEFVFVVSNSLDTDIFHIFQCFGKCRRADIVGGTGFEFKWKLVVGGFFKSYSLDHFAATLIGWDALEPLTFAIKHANTGGCINFMTRENIKVGIQLLNIYSDMRHSLCTVNKYGDIFLMSFTDHLFHRIDRTEYIRYLRNGNQTGVLID